MTFRYIEKSKKHYSSLLKTHYDDKLIKLESTFKERNHYANLR